ncbi:hypothetical protein FQN50_001336 [Emmonsiellopsis sp. PD_5]|nr:hypothetical protein FQN50_001336 [Emmonsiellopsis sp. PD_5]
MALDALKRLFSQSSKAAVRLQSLPPRTAQQSLISAKPIHARSLHLSARRPQPHLRTSRATNTTTTTNASGTPSSPFLSRLRLQSRTTRRQNSSKNSSDSSSSSSSSSSANETGFSARMKKLSREYGWSALGVYLALSALDFPFCFAAVRLLGVERIGHYEHVIVEGVKGVLAPIWPVGKLEEEEGGDMAMATATAAGAAGGAVGGESQAYDHGVLEADAKNKSAEASLWTQLALAYAIHKSFIFIRVPLTAAVTPKVVKTLRRWGWDIGKRKPKTP